MDSALALCGIPCLMLLAFHGAFFKDVPLVDGIVKPSDEFGTLRFFEFPTLPQSLHLVLSLYLTGEVRGMLSHRVRRWTDELYSSQPAEVHFDDPGTPRRFDYVYDIYNVIFPREGAYRLDVIFDRNVIYTAPLSIVQIKY